MNMQHQLAGWPEMQWVGLTGPGQPRLSEPLIPT